MKKQVAVNGGSFDSLKPFHVVQTGSYENTDQLLSSMEQKEIRFSSWAFTIFDGVQILNLESSVNLYVLEVSQVTGRNLSKIEDILKGLDLMGYKPCSAELGLLLRLKYLDQPVGEHLRILMEPIRSKAYKMPLMFTVDNVHGRLILGAEVCHPKFQLEGDVKVVFTD